MPAEAAVVVICSANICRSPVVEALLRRRFEEQSRDARVISAGTLGIVGAGAAEHSVSLAADIGLDLSGHVSRAVDPAVLDRAALVVCMAQSHVDQLLRAWPHLAPKVRRLADLAGEARDVPDPYGGPREGYQVMVDDVARLVDRAWPEILSHLA